MFQVDPSTTTTAPPPPASIVLVAGGDASNSGDRYSSEIIAENDSDRMKLPNLPKGTQTSRPSILKHNNTILYCNYKTCLQLKLGHLTGTVWGHHSSLNKSRNYPSGVSTNNASFLFGAWSSGADSYEYMEFGSDVWKNGQTSLPTSFYHTCVVAVSNEQILLIGGYTSQNSYDNRTWSFNTLTHTFTQLSLELNTGRQYHACIRIPNTEKILVTGGHDGYGYSGSYYLNSTEIIDLATQSVTYIGSMNYVRYEHGMGIMTIGNEDKVITFGGRNNSGYLLDSIEVYQEDTQTWELLGNKLSTPKREFGYLSIMNTGDTFDNSDLLNHY